MPDSRELLRRKFENNRYTNFGNVITKIVIKGIRCHSNTLVEIRSPITAFSGFNGTGKSTILQLAAASYKLDSGHYSVSDFIVKGPLDRAPFADDAAVQFIFETQQASDGGGLVSPGTVSISYNAVEKRWDGYDRRPVRTVFFGGVGIFLPRSERKDYVFKNSDRLRIANTNVVSEHVRDWAGKILRGSYDSISSNELKFRTFQDEVLSTVSGGCSYSESHMGCGEGKVQYLLAKLEGLPAKSLILLEEPETSLHPNAEYELGKYLIDLCIRKGHQVLITTHSEMLLRSLPQVSLVFLHRKNGAIQSLVGVTSSQASSLMANGFNKALTILVEDQAAKFILTELLRCYDDSFLQTVAISVAGEIGADGVPRSSGKDAIRNTMISLMQAGLKIAAVLDGGEKLQVDDAKRFIFKLPGSLAPEEALFQCGPVKAYLSKTYPILDLNALEGELRASDCHDYFKNIGMKVDCEEAFLLREAARVYANCVPATEANVLYEQLKDASQRK